ncbi:MAG: ABC transporter ATP-binding protein [Halieaceae bacterium]|nr:ABC transporter ATP-binding protein [Halieaceae bacterium]
MRQALDLFRDAYEQLGGKLIILMILMVLGTSLEGVGLAMLFPLLASLGLEQNQENQLVDLLNQLIFYVGIEPKLGPLLITIVCILLLQVSVTLIQRWFSTNVTNSYRLHWHQRLFHAFMESKWEFLMREKTAGQLNLILNESSRSAAALSVVLETVNAIFFVLVYATIALMAAWEVVLFLIIFGSAVYFLTMPITRHSKSVGHKVNTISEALYHKSQELLQNVKLIKFTSTEHVANNLFDSAANDFRSVYIRGEMIPALVMAVNMAIGYIILGLGAWLAIEIMDVSSSALLVSMYVFVRLYVQLSGLQQMRQSLALSIPAFTIASSQLASARKSSERFHEGEKLSKIRPASIELRNVEIRYESTKALVDVSYTIESGAIIGITGSSGAGKSTLLDAIVGLIEPSSGEVLVDKIPLRSLDVQDWRRSIGYVAQDTLLFEGTIARNIGWGHQDSSLEEIKDAARRAGAEEFIDSLPMGYDSFIGDRSVRISGGQRQRIGLARALLGNKRLIILDEATSSLDSKSEEVILETIKSLRGQVTIIIVAHRLSTLRLSDYNLVFDRGHLVEQGSFQSLLLKKGYFSNLWGMQTGFEHSDSTQFTDFKSGEGENE